MDSFMCHNLLYDYLTYIGSLEYIFGGAVGTLSEMFISKIFSRRWGPANFQTKMELWVPIWAPAMHVLLLVLLKAICFKHTPASFPKSAPGLPSAPVQKLLFSSTLLLNSTLPSNSHISPLSQSLRLHIRGQYRLTSSKHPLTPSSIWLYTLSLPAAWKDIIHFSLSLPHLLPSWDFPLKDIWDVFFLQ